MAQAIIFAITIFIGWVIFDGIKHKKVHRDNVIAGFITAIIAGAVWYLLFVIF